MTDAIDPNMMSSMLAFKIAQEIIDGRKEEMPDCPECGGEMVVRVNNMTKRPFYGCFGFPKCLGSREYDTGEEESKTPSCPKCGTRMAMRINKIKKIPFYGCSDYPKCDGTRDINGYADVSRPEPDYDYDEYDDYCEIDCMDFGDK